MEQTPPPAARAGSKVSQAGRTGRSAQSLNAHLSLPVFIEQGGASTPVSDVESEQTLLPAVSKREAISHLAHGRQNASRITNSDHVTAAGVQKTTKAAAHSEKVMKVRQTAHKGGVVRSYSALL